MKSRLNQLLFRGNFFLFSLIVFSACQTSTNPIQTENSSVVSDIIPQDTNDVNVQEIDAPREDVFSYETVYVEDQGWGYEIFNNGKLYINQPHIPAIQGIKGFKTSEKAATTAEFAIYKIENGILPPTLSKQELDSLDVLD